MVFGDALLIAPARCARSARIALSSRLVRRHSGTKSMSPRSSSPRRRAIRICASTWDFGVCRVLSVIIS
jgi:hypothetical protein